MRQSARTVRYGTVLYCGVLVGDRLLKARRALLLTAGGVCAAYAYASADTG